MSERNPYLLKLSVASDPDSEGEQKIYFKDFYLDATAIKGFYVPEDFTDPPESCITLVLQDGIFTVMQQEHIMDYLLDEFVTPAKG